LKLRWSVGHKKMDLFSSKHSCKGNADVAHVMEIYFLAITY